jgi:RNA recognition motif-containing protein
MGKRLFVGSLPYETTDQELQDIFAGVGAVESVKVIIDRDTGRSKGFGFVEMVTEKDAQLAIEKLNGYKIGERSIVVNEARPMEERGNPTQGFRPNRFSGGPRRDFHGAGHQKRW